LALVTDARGERRGRRTRTAGEERQDVCGLAREHEMVPEGAGN
jgi:hypothetical protein